MTRAVVATAYGGPEVLSLVDVDPGTPGPGQVLLEVRAAGVNPADWKAYTGAWGADPSKLPLRLGHEAAGVVLAVGPDVTDVAPGDEVLAQPVRGAYADRVVVPVTSLVRRPPTLDWPNAAGLLVAGTTAAHALDAVAVGAGDTLLVHGAAGSVGSILTQLARLKGVRVVGTAGSADHDYLERIGAVPVSRDGHLVDRLRQASPQGFQAAVDTVGTDEALEASVTLVGDRRKVATIAGFEHGARLGVRLLGHGAGADPGTEVRRSARPRLVDLAGQGRLTVRVGATYHLADVARAHRSAMKGGVHGKTVLLP